MKVSELQGNWWPVGDVRIVNEQSVAIFLAPNARKQNSGEVRIVGKDSG